MSTSNFTQDELKSFYASSRTVFLAFRSVFHLRHSANAGYYLQKLAYKPDAPLTLRGRFHAITPDDANAILV